MPILKRLALIIGTTCFMVLFFLFYDVYNQDTYRNFLLIESIAGTITILLIFNPATKKVKYAFSAGVATAIATFIIGATGTYIGWYLFLGGTIRILGVPIEMIIWVFFLGIVGAILTESPKYLRKLGGKIGEISNKFFDSIEHLDKLSGLFVILGVSTFATLLDFYSTRFGAFLTAPYWSFAFSFIIWLSISFTTVITYNYMKMPMEFDQDRDNENSKD